MYTAFYSYLFMKYCKLEENKAHAQLGLGGNQTGSSRVADKFGYMNHRSPGALLFE